MATNELMIGATAGGQAVGFLPRMANRHGLIAGATGTGKTKTLQGLAESFSRLGVPVFLADIKGDLAGLAAAGAPDPALAEKAKQLGIADYAPRAYPVIFWDLYGKQGHPVRTTISEAGPLILARLLDLNDTQAGVLHLAFKAADDQGLLLLDLKDLRALLAWLGEHAKELSAELGSISPATVGTIQRKLLELGQAGGELFFGEPALELKHLMLADASGRGVISILDGTKLVTDPRLYSTFLLWLLAELFEQLPEVGDVEKPKLVFFFDEAHLLFRDAPRPLLEKVEQVVRLIRSKGVGIYFISQNPLDIPETILGQLGNRVQHALRAFTPADQKAVKAAARTFRANPKLDTEQAITELGVGEALVSGLDAAGTPTVVEQTSVRPPESRMGAISDAERKQVVVGSPVTGIYDAAVDRESAFEVLKQRAAGASAPAPSAAAAAAPVAGAAGLATLAASLLGGTGRRQGMGEALVKSAVRAAGSQVGRQLVRGLLGSLLGGRR